VKVAQVAFLEKLLKVEVFVEASIGIHHEQYRVPELVEFLDGYLKCFQNECARVGLFDS
jgi:hypothetical protein